MPGPRGWGTSARPGAPPEARGVSSAGAPAFQDVADNPAISLRVFLRTPHETMPDLILTAAETDNVIAYILSLK